MEKVVRITCVYYGGLSCIAGVIRHTVIVSQLTEATGYLLATPAPPVGIQGQAGIDLCSELLSSVLLI